MHIEDARLTRRRARDGRAGTDQRVAAARARKARAELSG